MRSVLDLMATNIVCDLYRSVSRSDVTCKHGDVTVVGYYFCDESIPYRTTTPGNWVTLAQFKRLLSKRGNFRFVTLMMAFL